MTNLWRGLLFLTLATTSAAGCASATSNGQASRPNRNELTRTQLEETRSETVYDAILKLRPTWFTSRGPTSVTNSTPTEVNVYMNGTLLGKADYLREVRLIDVASVRYWEAGEASTRFGMGNLRGVIELIPNGGR